MEVFPTHRPSQVLNRLDQELNQDRTEVVASKTSKTSRTSRTSSSKVSSGLSDTSGK